MNGTNQSTDEQDKCILALNKRIELRVKFIDELNGFDGPQQELNYSNKIMKIVNFQKHCFFKAHPKHLYLSSNKPQ